MKYSRCAVTMLVAFGCTVLMLTSAAAGSKPLLIESLLDAEVIAPGWSGQAIQISPDGRWIALLTAKRNPDFEFFKFGVGRSTIKTKLQVINIKTGKVAEIASPEKEPSWPVWSPDSQYLLFQSGTYDDVRLWMWSMRRQQTRQVSDAMILSSNDSPAYWTPDGRSIVVAIFPENHSSATIARLRGEKYVAAAPSLGISSQSRALCPAVAVYKNTARSQVSVAEAIVDQEGFVTNSMRGNGYLGDIALIDVASGHFRRVAVGYRPTSYRISADGRMLAFTHYVGLENGDGLRNVHDVMAVSLFGGKPYSVVNHVVQTAFGMDIHWSHADLKLLYCQDATSSSEGCYIVDASSKIRSRVDSFDRWRPLSATRPPSWSSAGNHLYAVSKTNSVLEVKSTDLTEREFFAPTGMEIIQLVENADGVVAKKNDLLMVHVREVATDNHGFFSLDVRTGVWVQRLLDAIHISFRRPIDFDVKSNLIAYISERADASPQLFVSNFDFKTQRQLSTLNPDLQQYKMGKSQLIRWVDADNEPMRGALLLPPAYEAGRRYPLVLDIYGGRPVSQALNMFGVDQIGDATFNRQLLATQGYAVLKADTRAREGAPMTDIVKSALLGVDAAIKEGFVDPERMAVTGQSYGGYSALAIITQSQRFKAAIVAAGSTHMLEVFSATLPNGAPDSTWIGWAESGQGRLRASLWEDRDRWIENSPLFFFDKISTPVLLLYGADDRTGHGGIPAFLALQRLGKEVELAQYRNEGHGILGRANAIDYSKRMIAFLNVYLK